MTNRYIFLRKQFIVAQSIDGRHENTKKSSVTTVSGSTDSNFFCFSLVSDELVAPPKTGEEKSEELTSSSLPCDGQGIYDLKDNKVSNRVLITRKREEKKTGRLKVRARYREAQWKISEDEVEKRGIEKGHKRESVGHMYRVFINCGFGPGAELPAHRHEKCSCVICFSKDVPEGLEGSTEGSPACNSTGKTARRSWDVGGPIGCHTARAGWWQVIQCIPVSCFLHCLDLTF